MGLDVIATNPWDEGTWADPWPATGVWRNAWWMWAVRVTRVFALPDPGGVLNSWAGDRGPKILDFTWEQVVPLIGKRFRPAVTLWDSLMLSGLFESWVWEPFHLAALIPSFQLSGPYSCPISTLSLSPTRHRADSPGRPQQPSRTGLPNLCTHFSHCMLGHESTSNLARRGGIKALLESVLINLV